MSKEYNRSMPSHEELTRFPELRSAVGSAFLAGLSQIRETGRRIVAVAVSGDSFSRYERTLGDVFDPVSNYDIAFSDFSRVRLSDLAPRQVQNVTSFIYQSAKIANVFTGKESDSNGNNIIDPLEVVNTMFRLYLVRMKLYTEFWEPAFEDIYNAIEAELAASHIEQVFYAPVIGLDLLVDEIVLDEDIIVRRMTDDEISFAIQMNALSTSSVAGGFYIPSSSQIAVTFTNLMDYTATHEIDRVPPDMDAAVDRFLSAVRLTLGGSLEVRGILSKVRPTLLRMPFGASAKSRPSGNPDPIRSCVIATEAAASRISRLYELSDSDRLDKMHLDIALRRFRDSASRSSAEDRLIDLVIAAESVCGDDSPTELSFKLGLRMTLIVAPYKKELESRAIHGFVSRVYGTRSQVVHGGKKSRDQKRSAVYPLLDGTTTIDLSQTVAQFEELLSILLNVLIATEGIFQPNGTEWWNRKVWDRLRYGDNE